jgi:hypothetical protein
MVVPELLTTQVRQCRVRLTLGTHYISRTGGNTYCFDGAGSLLLSSTTPERYDLELSDPGTQRFRCSWSRVKRDWACRNGACVLN